MINNPINKDTQISCSAIKDIYQRKFIKKKPCIILIITFVGDKSNSDTINFLRWTKSTGQISHLAI
jgi:hypothetical protein